MPAAVDLAGQSRILKGLQAVTQPRPPPLTGRSAGRIRLVAAARSASSGRRHPGRPLESDRVDHGSHRPVRDGSRQPVESSEPRTRCIAGTSAVRATRSRRTTTEPRCSARPIVPRSVRHAGSPPSRLVGGSASSPIPTLVGFAGRIELPSNDAPPAAIGGDRSLPDRCAMARRTQSTDPSSDLARVMFPGPATVRAGRARIHRSADFGAAHHDDRTHRIAPAERRPQI